MIQNWDFDDSTIWLKPIDLFLAIEMLSIATPAAQRPSAMEIGVWKGGWLLQLTAAHPNATSIGVDPYPGSPDLAEHVQQRIAGKGLSDRVELVASTTEACAARCIDDITHHQYSVIHIDGLHDEEHVTQELNYAIEHCSATGTVIVDDYLHPAYPGVASAMYQFLGREDFAMFLVTPNKAYLCPTAAHRSHQQQITAALDRAALTWETHKGQHAGARYIQKPDVMGFPVALCLDPANNDIVLEGLPTPRQVRLQQLRQRWVPPGARDLLRPVTRWLRRRPT